MRKAAGKKYGYIIIPVVIPIDKNPEDVLSESADFSTVWDILNALRAHDERMDIFIQKISLNKVKGNGRSESDSDDEHIFIQGTFDFGELEKVI